MIMENKSAYSLPLSTGISLGVHGKKLSTRNTKRIDENVISNTRNQNSRKGGLFILLFY